MTLVKALSLFLGLMSVAFGALKFVDPFKGWYSVQIASSGLPEPAFALGIGAELLTGLLFLLPFLVALNDRKKLLLLTLANNFVDPRAGSSHRRAPESRRAGQRVALNH